MCGIAGLLGATAEPAVPRVQRMTDALAHRGPDAQGVWSEGSVCLGHRRLGIIDTSSAGNQPFHSADGRQVLVFNGEIYNYRELHRVLLQERPDLVFRTRSDTEVLLMAYRVWGPACLDRLEGMFAFAVHDRDTQEVFIARDRLGIKPLYLYRNGGELLFASELRALLASGSVPRRMDRTALADHLRYQTVHAPATLVEGVRMLMPGNWMRWRNGVVEEQAWWSPLRAVDPAAAGHDKATVHREVRERLGRAVEKRLVSDVPFGAFLSGGIDSSAIVGLMAQASTAPVHTFSVVFNEERYSEERYARIVADKFRTEHTVIRLTPGQMLGFLPDALAAMDHPSADGPNTWVVSKVTKEAGITMALSGTGGDEVFAGYDVFRRSLDLERKAGLANLPSAFRTLAGWGLRTAKGTASAEKAAGLFAAGDLAWPNSYPWSRLAFTDAAIRSFTTLSELPTNAVRRIVEALDQGGAARLPKLSQVSLAELSTYLQNVLLRDADQMSMAHALEVRVPFLDHHLVGYVLGIPDTIKYPHTPKQLLVDSLGDLLPRAIVDRPKMGFVLPWEDWLKNDLRTFAQDRLRQLGGREPFDAKGLEQLWQRFLSGDRRVTWSRIWQLVVLADWLERNGVE
ncbi:MAG TPA: asparagine synthase (glutamine-hydrolyzing) [Flavobacteriales bacterium]